MSHLLWVTYTGDEHPTCQAAGRYPVIGITPSGGVWVIDDTGVLAVIERHQYAIHRVIYDESPAPPVVQPSQDEAYPTIIKRPRGRR